MATKITWLHLSADIPLSILIAFIFQLIFIGLFFGITICIYPIIEKLISCHSTIISFVGNSLSYITLMKNAPAVISSFIYLFLTYYNIVWVKFETSSDII